MPMYSFQCSKCNVKEDKFFSMSGRPDHKEKLRCESCGKKALKRIFEIPNVDDGPKTLGSMSDLNIKRNPKMGEKSPQQKEYERLTKISQIKDKTNYIMTGET